MEIVTKRIYNENGAEHVDITTYAPSDDETKLVYEFIRFFTTEGKFVDIVNAYHKRTKTASYKVRIMDEFNDEMNGFNAWEIASFVARGSFNPWDEWFYFDRESEELHSAFDPWGLFTEREMEEIARYIAVNRVAFENPRIRAFLEGKKSEVTE